MQPDWLFVAAGAAVVLIAVSLVVNDWRRRCEHRWVATGLWALLGAGLLCQGFSPHWRIAHNAFVVPPPLLSHGMKIDPVAIVQRQKQMQLLSGVLTSVAALGLAYHYRRAFVRARSPPDSAGP